MNTISHFAPKERIPLSIQGTDTGEEKNRLDRIPGWYQGKAEPDCHHLSYGRPADFQITEDGQYYIHDKRNKTGVFYTAVILEQGVEILKKYHFKLPIIGNHKLNVYLKTIRDLCGIDKPIFSHVARHTYATRCLKRGIRLEVVAKLLGHSTTRITQHYAKLLKYNILEEVKDAFERSY